MENVTVLRFRGISVAVVLLVRIQKQLRDFSFCWVINEKAIANQKEFR